MIFSPFSSYEPLIAWLVSENASKIISICFQIHQALQLQCDKEEKEHLRIQFNCTSELMWRIGQN